MWMRHSPCFQETYTPHDDFLLHLILLHGLSALFCAPVVDIVGHLCSNHTHLHPSRLWETEGTDPIPSFSSKYWYIKACMVTLCLLASAQFCISGLLDVSLERADALSWPSQQERKNLLFLFWGETFLLSPPGLIKEAYRTVAAGCHLETMWWKRSLKTKPKNHSRAKRLRGVEVGVEPEPEPGNNCTSGLDI